MLRALRSLTSFRPGIAYVLGDSLYLAPTSRSPAANTMRSCRGPNFASTNSGLATSEESGFSALPTDAPEPSAHELATLVDDFYASLASTDDSNTNSNTNPLGSMGEMDGGVVFQGNGDPLAATSVVIETVRLVAEQRNGIAFRLNTLGLCGPTDLEELLLSGVLAVGDHDQRRETRIATVSVFLPAAEPVQYAALLQPHNNNKAFQDVCSFCVQLAEAGVNLECTAVDRPDVNVAEVKALALSLGARSFRTRSWIG
jgi:hypothetical protein